MPLFSFSLSLSPDHLLQPLVMAFHHRKLINETLVAACEPYCDINTKNATCPTFCLNFCPPGVCKSYLTLPPPPPLPSPPPPVSVSIDPEKSQKLSLLLTASLAILATAFFLFTCYIIYKFYTVWSSSRRRRLSLGRQSHGGPDDDSLDEDYGPVVDHPIWYIRTIGLQPSVINAITIVKYKRADGVVEGSDCAVCLNEFQEDETLRLLPKCNHAFHIPCIDTWLGSHTNCPMCRAPIINNSPDPSPQDSAVHDSGQVEEAGLEIEGRGRRETRVRIEDDRTSRSQIGIEIDENLDSKVDLSGLDSIQPVRRSVSMDSISALAISAAVANAIPLQSDRSSNNEMVKAKESVVNQGLARLVGSPLIERCMQSGSSSIKRSASCSAKVFLSRHSSRSRN